MHLAAVALLIVSESQRLSRALDHPLTSSWFPLLHLESPSDLYDLTIFDRTVFKILRSFGDKLLFSFLANVLSEDVEQALCALHRFLRLRRPLPG
jgi:hypothetical protein